MSKNQIDKFYLEVFGLPVPARPTRPPQELTYLDNNSKGRRVMLYKDSETKNGIYFLSTTFHSLCMLKGSFVWSKHVDEAVQHPLLPSEDLTRLFHVVGL